MLNLAPTPSEILSAAINEKIDGALQAENAKQKRRDYLGASRLGEECMRQLWFEFNCPDQASPFPGRVLRRFLLGHMQEDETARWLILAGFDLRREKTHGALPGFEFRDSDAPLGGHIDGDIFGGPIQLPYPVHWEHKIAKSSSWASFVKDGVAVSHPVYYAQCIIYSAKLGRTHTLFTMFNTDTSELRFELVANNVGKANELLAKGRKIVTARAEQEMPRIALTETDYRCRMCRFAAHCWRPDATPPRPAMPVMPSWARR